jgi:hypothetical protein
MDTGKHISKSSVEAGDLIFRSGGGHVGMYIGNNKVIHAPHTGDEVRIVSFSSFVAAGGITYVRPTVLVNALKKDEDKKPTKTPTKAPTKTPTPTGPEVPTLPVVPVKPDDPIFDTPESTGGTSSISKYIS